MSKRKDILRHIDSLFSISDNNGFSGKQRSIGLLPLDQIAADGKFPLLEIINGDEVHTPGTNQQLSGELTVLMAITDKPKEQEFDLDGDNNGTFSNLMDTVFDVMNSNQDMDGNALSTILTKTETERQKIENDTFQRAVMSFTISFDV